MSCALALNGRIRPLRRVLSLTILMALVPTWLSASACMVCPHMIGHEEGAGQVEASHERVAPTATESHGAMGHDAHGEPSAPSSHSEGTPDNCPCDTFCSVAPAALDTGMAERSSAEELSEPVLDRPESEALRAPERPPFFLPLPTAPPADG